MQFLSYVGFAVGATAIVLTVILALRPHRPKPVVIIRHDSHFPPAVRPDVTDAAAVLRNVGFDSLADKMLGGLQPCVALVPDERGQAEPARYRTRIGGLPDLLDAGMWPTHEGDSLAFVAQIDLAELASVWPGDELPSGGVLCFFYHPDQRAWGFDPADRGKSRVIHIEHPPTTRGVSDFPQRLPEEGRFAERAMRLEAASSLPEMEELLAAGPQLPREQRSELSDVLSDYETCRSPLHQIFGHASRIQGEMRLECQLVSHGLYCGDAKGYGSPSAKELEAGAADWRLLLQVDTDDDAKMMWGDGGRLYFWIREDDLRSRSFENVWTILQCY